MKRLILVLTACAMSLTIIARAEDDDSIDAAALQKLVSNPTSDLSTLDSEQLEAAAQLAGQAYAAAHPRKYNMEDYEIGTKSAFKHHLLGSKVGYWRSSFFEALQAN